MKAFVDMADTRNMSREDWLTHRQAGIGGSDAAAIVGLNPYSSPLRVYADKLGQLPETETTEQMRLGTDLEGYVASRFTEASGLRVRRENHILQSIEHPFMLANVDRMVIGKKAGLECKTTNPWTSFDWEIGEVPDTYYTQCQHYMAVTGYADWYLAVIVFGRGFYWYHVPRNDEDIEALVEAEEHFWTEHVVPQVPPEPNGSDADSEVVRTLCRRADGTAEILLDGVDAELDRLAEIDALSKRLKKEADAIKQGIQLRMGDAARASTPRYKISWPEVTSTRLDTRKIRAEAPEIYEQYATESVSRRFTYKTA